MSDNIKLIKWVVVTDSREYLVSEQEKEAILKADAMGARFVSLEKAVINIAFIKEIYRKVEFRDSKFSSISESEKKYLERPVTGGLLE